MTYWESYKDLVDEVS